MDPDLTIRKARKMVSGNRLSIRLNKTVAYAWFVQLRRCIASVCATASDGAD